MLDRLRNKVSRLFKEDEPEEVKEEPNYQQAFQTKVMYQYPTKSSFRFPVIPDDEERERDPLDTPAFQRRTREKRQDVITKNNEEKMTKKENQRFVPTQVPSPIYGYQKYKEKREIENIPAFVRKQDKKQPETIEKRAFHQADVKEQVTTKKTIPVEKVDPVNEDRHDQVLDKNDDHLQSSNQLNEQNKQVERSKSRHLRKKTFNNEQKKAKTNPVPFNVMMSANDKRHLVEKRNPSRAKYQKHDDQSSKKQAVYPSHLLNDPEIKTNEDRIWVQNQQELLEETLKHFNVKAKVVNATQGASVTRFEVQPELGVKVSRVRNLNDDIKLNMSAKDIRIEAPIPGKNTIGIEVPNLKPQMVGLQQILDTPAFQQSKSPLTIGLGLNVEGEPLVTNISKMPHGLIAGATGSGKSVCINTILISLLYKASHEDIKD